MKFIFGALAAAAIAGVAFSQPAEARCFWNGFETVCIQHRGMIRDFDRPFHRDFDRPYHREWRDSGWDR
jgi:hypothetical protein